MLYKYLVAVSVLLVLMGCSSKTADTQVNKPVSQNIASDKITLSHIKAYLLNGNIQKAEQLFQSIDNKGRSANAMLLLAEIHAANGNSVDAQQVFLTALNDSQIQAPLEIANVPNDLLVYFCSEKKWPALQGYAAALVTPSNENNIKNVSSSVEIIKNNALTQIALCFFDNQRWDDASQYLQQLDVSLPSSPRVYLALARMAVEQKQYLEAQRQMTKYEQNKDTVDAKTLWTTIEVYLALNQPDKAIQTGENLSSLFAFNQYTRQYILLTKRGLLQDNKSSSTSIVASNSAAPQPEVLPSQTQRADLKVHIIQKGETLYQLAKRYGLTTPELLSWNPELQVDNISLGTVIRLTSK